MYNKFLESIVTNPRFYRFLGFTIVRNVLDQNEVKNFRDHIFELFTMNEIDDRILSPRFFLKSSQLRGVIFNSKIVTPLKKIFGDPYVKLGDFHVLRNSFGGWHVDSGSECMAPYLFSKKYGLGKCGLFLQGNSREYGGVIRIRWFSHLFLYNRFPTPIRYFIARFYHLLRLSPILDHTVKLNAGDFIVFDSRLEHASAIPDGVTHDKTDEGYFRQPPEHSKYTIYWDSCNLWSKNDFIQNAVKRAFMEEYFEAHCKTKSRIANSDFLSTHFPTDFSTDFVNNAQNNNIIIASLEGDKLNKLKKLYKLVSQPFEE